MADVTVHGSIDPNWGKSHYIVWVVLLPFCVMVLPDALFGATARDPRGPERVFSEEDVGKLAGVLAAIDCNGKLCAGKDFWITPAGRGDPYKYVVGPKKACADEDGNQVVCEEEYYLIPVDLNGDGQPEYIINQRGGCGSAGCFEALFMGGPNGWENLAEVFGALIVEQTRTRGMRDITLSHKHYTNTGFENWQAHLKWNGSEYVVSGFSTEPPALAKNASTPPSKLMGVLLLVGLILSFILPAFFRRPGLVATDS